MGFRFVLFICAFFSAFFAFAGVPRPVELADILAWKGAAVSSDGRWFAYQAVPTEGDGTVVVRSLADGKEQRDAIGDGMGTGPVFSDDGKWVALAVHPTTKEGKALRKQKKAPQRKAVLLELATGKKTEFEKIRGFAFNGEAATHLALHRYGAEGPAAPPAAAGPGATPSNRPMGADLLLVELASGQQLNFGNVSEYEFDKKGTSLAFVIDAQDQAGNGVQWRDMKTGAVLPVDSARAWYKGLTWTEKGDALAVVRGVEDKGYEDKLYTVVGAKLGAGGIVEKVTFDPKTAGELTASANRAPYWMDDLSAVVFGVVEPKKKKAGKGEEKKDEPKKEDDAEQPDLVLWHFLDKRLPAMQQVKETQDKNFSYVALYRPAEQKFVRLADETMRTVRVNAQSQWAVGVDTRDYERMSNLDGRRYSDVFAVDLKTGERKRALTQARWFYDASPDGTHLLSYRDGHFYTFEIATGKSFNVTEKLGTSFVNTEDDHNVDKSPRRQFGWSKDGKYALLQDGWDLWRVPVHGGGGTNLTANGKRERIRYEQIFELDPETRGTDLSQPVYVRMYGEWTKKSGVTRVEGGVSKSLEWGDAAYAGLLKAEGAEVFAYIRQSPTEVPEYYSAGAMLGDGAKITDMNPQKGDLALSAGARLVDYTSDKGDKLQAALLLPAGYEPGKRYPLLVYIYERMSQTMNLFPPMGNNGFSPGASTSNGYAVLLPDIQYTVKDPGMSAVWCVVPAVKAAVATGIADAERVGLQGHSWGGYQTAFLVTQTKTFKAAVAGAPLTDMVSMYSSVYWNTGSANQPIFESSQGRFTGSYLEQPEAYVRNSPVYHGNKVETPLMILHNDRDGAVDFTQGVDYFNTLKRLQKPVMMLQY